VRIRRGTVAGMSDFGRSPNHETPWWGPTDATFHIRIRIAPDSWQLTVPAVAGALLKSVRFYSEKRRWHFTIFLLMPDHLHALLTFPADQCMSDVVGDWKRWHTLHSGVERQENFFDHRIRTDAEREEKFRYIRNNPIVKGLCARPADWPWQSLGTDDESRPLDAARFDR
jgi:REP element-mobilizing transposase RayT